LNLSSKFTGHGFYDGFYEEIEAMRFLVYGAGAIGQALGCMLSCAGHQVELILRPRFIEELSAGGLRVKGILGDYYAPPGTIGLFDSVEGLTQNYDYTLITTKSYDTAIAAADLVTLGDHAGVIVSLQNGCGNVEILARHFDPQRIIGARVITGFEITALGEVTITVSADAIHVGDCIRGNISPKTAKLALAIDQAGHQCLAVPDIYQSLFAKLLYNCALNPLGAILGVNYGPLAENPSTRQIIDTIIDETFAVIYETGGTTAWQDAGSYRRFFYSQLIPATANHRPSMLQDLENSKRTEVEALVGYVSAEGKKHGVATPTCDTMAALIRFREAQVIARAA
jgi:2-dehydropantoate 2-reductase